MKIINITEDQKTEYMELLTDALLKIQSCMEAIDEGEVDTIQLNFIQKIDSIL